MQYNPIVWFIAAVIPLITGFIWYSPVAFSKAWMKSARLTDEDLKGANMALIFGLTYVFGLFLAVGLTSIVVHQTGVFSLFAEEYQAGDTTIKPLVDDIMTKYGEKHRHFGHGALHGGIAAILIALPLIGINGMFERHNWKYVAIHTGYWFVTMVLMGGLLCQFI